MKINFFNLIINFLIRYTNLEDYYFQNLKLNLLNSIFQKKKSFFMNFVFRYWK
jgi:hypothetical protein